MPGDLGCRFRALKIRVAVVRFRPRPVFSDDIGDTLASKGFGAHSARMPQVPDFPYARRCSIMLGRARNRLLDLLVVGSIPTRPTNFKYLASVTRTRISSATSVLRGPRVSGPSERAISGTPKGSELQKKRACVSRMRPAREAFGSRCAGLMNRNCRRAANRRG